MACAGGDGADAGPRPLRLRGAASIATGWLNEPWSCRAGPNMEPFEGRDAVLWTLRGLPGVLGEQAL